MTYENLATKYAEDHGIIDYTEKNGILTYYSNYPQCLSLPRRTYKVQVNLITGEEFRKLMKRLNSKGNHNLYK